MMSNCWPCDSSNSAQEYSTTVAKCACGCRFFIEKLSPMLDCSKPKSSFRCNASNSPRNSRNPRKYFRRYTAEIDERGKHQDKT